MALTRLRKKEILNCLRYDIKNQRAAFFADYTGLGAKDMNALRSLLKTENAVLRVTKKTLFGLAFQDCGEETARKVRELNGQLATAFVFGDTITCLKLFWKFSRKNVDFKILGGVLDAEFQPAEKFKVLYKLPSEKGLKAIFVSQLAAPLQGMAGVLKANLSALVCVLSQMKKS